MTIQIFTTKQRILGPAPEGGENMPGSVPLDAVLSEGTETSLSVTAFPVERGADINDHAIIRPRTYTLRGVITDTPGFKYWKVNYAHVSARTRSTAAYAMMEELQARREPFDILTGFRLYQNMIIHTLSTTRNERTQAMIRFTATLIELRLVTNLNVALDKDQYDETVKASAAPEKDAGVQQGQETTLLQDAATAVGF